MEQILVTIDDTHSLASVRNAIKMLRGVVSTSIIKNVSKPTEEEKQKTYVKDSLTRAIRVMKVAKIEGRKLQSVDDFINEISDKNALPL